MTSWRQGVWVELCVWCGWCGGGGRREEEECRRRQECRTKNKNPTQRCGEKVAFWGCVPLTHPCQCLLSRDMLRDGNGDAMPSTNSWTLPWVDQDVCKLGGTVYHFHGYKLSVVGKCWWTWRYDDMIIIYQSRTILVLIFEWLCVRPQFVVSPLLITRCAEECPKGLHMGFPETNLLGIPFFPEILNIKISCSYNGVRITISGAVCTRMASIGIPGSGLGMFQLSWSFTVLFRCPKTMIKTHVDWWLTFHRTIIIGLSLEIS